jgi:hypothetical protein
MESELARARSAEAAAVRRTKRLEAEVLRAKAHQLQDGPEAGGAADDDMADARACWHHIIAENPGLAGSPDPREEQLALLASCMQGRSCVLVAAPGGQDAGHHRLRALQRRPGDDVLVPTIIASHGLNSLDVDFTGWLQS